MNYCLALRSAMKNLISPVRLRANSHFLSTGIMATETATHETSVRISKIAGRFLVFDAAGASILRREQNTCGTLVGTVPQLPTQNIFLGLPIELRPEEVLSLVQREAAHVVDDVTAHQTALRSSDRSAYIESIRRKRQAAQRVLAEKHAQKAAQSANKFGRSHTSPSPPEKTTCRTVDDPDRPYLFENSAPEPSAAKGESQMKFSGLTPTTSTELVSADADRRSKVNDALEDCPLARFLQGSGYFMTPGLRFGARYSVYPGDPLRFHAHYMTNQYDWDEDIPLLHIVEASRLATAVKKAFLIGGEEPSNSSVSDSHATVRTFSIEWAGM